MYELKIIQFKIYCIFWKNQDGGHLINGVHITILRLQPSWMACCMLSFYPKPLNKVILENRLHKFKQTTLFQLQMKADSML